MRSGGWCWFGKQQTEKPEVRNPLVVQWLGLSALTVGAPGSIPGQGTKIPQAAGRWGKQGGRKVTLQKCREEKAEVS